MEQWVGTDPDSGPSPHVYELQAVLKIPGLLASRDDVDYPRLMSSAPTYGRVDGPDELHSPYLIRRDLVKRHEPSMPNFIDVHDRIRRPWVRERNLAAGSEPIGAQALY